MDLPCRAAPGFGSDFHYASFCPRLKYVEKNVGFSEKMLQERDFATFFFGAALAAFSGGVVGLSPVFSELGVVADLERSLKDIECPFLDAAIICR